MADASSSTMETIGAASPLSMQAVMELVIASACSHALAAIRGLLPNQMLRLGLGVREQMKPRVAQLAQNLASDQFHPPLTLIGKGRVQGIS